MEAIPILHPALCACHPPGLGSSLTCLRKYSPLTQAAAALNLDRFNIELDFRCDILDNDRFHAILRLCWSGLMDLACFAPPCKEFSRLKLRLAALRHSGHRNTWTESQA